jgi:hypothetical protein
MDLARVFCFEGKINESRAVVDRVLEFNPDMSEAKKLMDGLHQPKPNCGL